MTKITPEQAQKILEEHPADSDFLNAHLRAIIDGTLAEYYITLLKDSKDYSDELPQGRSVGPWHPDFPFMKCRGNIITSISLLLQGVIGDGIIHDESVINIIEQYVTHEWNAFRGKKYWTTPEEIQLINDTIDAVIACIEQTHTLDQDKIRSISETLNTAKALEYNKWYV